jgi:hypothetical protein
LIPADNFVITRFSGESVSRDLLVQVAYSNADYRMAVVVQLEHYIINCHFKGV